MNIEIKTPRNPEIIERYRCHEAIEKVHDLILGNGLAEYSIIQTFNHETLRYFEKVNAPHKDDEKKKINTLYLENFYSDAPLSKTSEMLKNGRGSHMQLSHLNPELMKTMTENEKLAGIWIDCSREAPYNKEDARFL